MREIASVILVAVTLGLLYLVGPWPAVAAVPPASTYTVKAEDGRQLYAGASNAESWGRCLVWVLRDARRACTWRRESTAQGVPFTQRLKIVHGADTGVWTWVAPTALESGDILTDLSHYLLYRQAPGTAPAVWAQVDGRTTRAVFTMLPEFYGACFWVVAVRKPATSPAVASDKSNSICMDERGQPAPGSGGR